MNRPVGGSPSGAPTRRPKKPTCAKLGSMGVPYKVVLKGQPVLLCCPGCEGKAKDAPDETLEKVARLKSGKSP